MAASGGFVGRLGTGAGDPGRDGGRCGGLPRLRPLAERVTMGLSLSANHFWHVKIGKDR